jgi:hypothetical protein
MREILDISKIYKSNAETKNFKLIKATWSKESYDFWTPKEPPEFDDLYPLHWIYRKESEQDIGKDYVALVHKQYGTMMSSHASEIISCKDFLDKAVTLYKAESEKYYAKYSNIKKQRIISNLIDL